MIFNYTMNHFISGYIQIKQIIFNSQIHAEFL